ncbi:MAG: hypothetical protein KIS73_12580 [Enhydrobacter sp.]|nr:hypothetical protein [Enhydrobacter sp.]
MTRQDRILIARFCGVLINAILCAALGALAGGLTGAQIGLVLGICLSVLPGLVRLLARLLNKPKGMVRFLAHEVAEAILRVAGVLVDRLDAYLSPVAAALRGVVLVGRLIADLVAGLLGPPLARIGSAMATPLGLANLAALAVIAANLAGLDFAAPVAFLGLGMLVLVLIVSEHEARTAHDGRAQGEEQ